MWIVAGLGNPGQEYTGTRHNAGRDFVMALAKNAGEFSFDKKLRAQVCKGTLFETKISFVCPDTMMNNSGASLKPLVASSAQAKKLIVAHDDLDLPLGKIKLSFGSGAGGHKGVASIQKALTTKDFIRIRFGISPATPSGKLKKPDAADVVDFVLGTFRAPEREKMNAARALASEALKLTLTESVAKAMTIVNAAV